MRSLRTILLTTMIFLLGCNSSSPSVPTETSAPAATATLRPMATIPATQEPRVPVVPLTADQIAGQHIRFLHAWDGLRGEQLDALVERFNLENDLDITVTAERDNDLFNTIRSGLKEGPAPQLTVGFNYHAVAWNNEETLPDLTPYFTDPVWGFSEMEQDDFIPAFIAQANTAGKMLGLPFYRTAEVLLYNAGWAAELGFSDPPTTPDEVREQACAANAALRAAAGATNQGGLLLNYEPTALIAWMLAFNGGFSGTVEGDAFHFDREENTRAFSYLREMVDDACAWVTETEDGHTAFANRRALFLSTTLAGVPWTVDAMTDTGSADRWLVLPYPKDNGAAQTLVHGPDLIMLPGTESEQLAAWVFMKWLSAPENNAAWLALSGYYPVRQSGLGTSWLQTADWIPNGSPLPAVASWPMVQWAVSDTARVLFAPLITINDIPAILTELDSLSSEIAKVNP